jgi:hypothetical protein
MVNKLRNRRWVRHMACIEQNRNIHRLLVRNLKERDRLKDLGVGDRIILKPSLKKQNRSVWTDFIWHRIRTSPL